MRAWLLSSLVFTLLVPGLARAGVTDPVRTRIDVNGPGQLALGSDPDRLTFVHGIGVDGHFSVDLAPAFSLTLGGLHQAFVYGGGRAAPPGFTLDQVEDASVSAVLLGLELRKRLVPGVTGYLDLSGGAGFFGGGHRHYSDPVNLTGYVVRGVSDSAPAYAAAAGVRLPVPWVHLTLDLGWLGLEVRSRKQTVSTNAGRVGLVL